MSTYTHFPDALPLRPAHAHDLPQLPAQRPATGSTLPADITRAASKQTYATICLLADRDRRLDALRAYAYFRWVDDCVDDERMPRADRARFLERQQTLLDAAYAGTACGRLSAEEQMLFDLVAGDDLADSGLRAYLTNMMAVMAFDVARHGQRISQDALAGYTHALAVAVTEALHFFIGHDQPTPLSKARYQAVTAAHITHLLRDTFEDVEAGYFNIAREFVETRGITPEDVTSEIYRDWVKERVALARAHFAAGRAELARVRNWRCRLAGAAYIARFETVLDAIERDDFRLRREYNDRKTLPGMLRMVASTLRTCAGWAAHPAS